MHYPPTKTTPWMHQIECWKLASKKSHFYIAHDMGAGKSKTAVDDINGFEGKSILIICPAKVIPNWVKQFNLHSAYPYNVLALTKGTSQQKAQAVADHIKNCRTRPVVVTNYESFWRYPLGCQMQKFKIKKAGILFQQNWDYLIFDEAHRIKSPSGRASWAAAALAKKANRHLALSGTPMPHSPLDLYAQMRAIDPTVFGTSFNQFKAEYAIMGGFEGRQVVQWKNLEDLHRRFFNVAHYVSADEALDLPETMDITIECSLNPKTMQLYHELDRELIAEVDAGVITVSNALDKLIRLQQITIGQLVLKDTAEQIIDNNKIDTLLEIVSDINPKEPVVIFYLFRSEGKRIRAGLKKLNRTVAEISGQRDEQDLFESGAADTALVQIQSGAEGLDNLKRARYCIYSCIGFSLGRYSQSRRRLWRPGQTRKVVYYHVVAKGTVDRKIMRSLKQKQEIVNHILSEIRNCAIGGK